MTDEQKQKDVARSRKYIRAIGRRKTAVAQVHLFPNGTGDIVVNGKKVEAFFPYPAHREMVLQPLIEVGQREKLDLSIKLAGGGVHAQAEASRHGVSRALVELNENFKKPLRKRGFLTRDARRVERKKPGLKKARRAPQWKKR